jgi:hypothetical protein
VGGWAAQAAAVNTLIDDLVRPTTEIARTIGAVAGRPGRVHGTRGRRPPLKGEFLRSAKLVNTMIQQLAVLHRSDPRRARSVPKASWAARRRSRRVGRVEGSARFGQQMAGNLTAQVRNIAE